MALIDKDIYGKLKKLRQELEQEGVPNLAHVFVPVGVAPPPPPTGTVSLPTPPAAPRLLFVGRATRNYCEGYLDMFEGAVAEDTKILSELPLGKTAFWQFARAITRSVLQQTSVGTSNDALAAHCGWSNLMKIGAAVGNPQGRLLDRQAQLCVEALRAEIARFRPTGIVIATGDYAKDEVVVPIFGRDRWSYNTPDGKQVAYQTDAETGAVVAWTDHPGRRAPPGTRAQVQSFVADLIVRGMGGSSLPPCSYRE